ncbi:MAG: ribosome biogenesis GTPase Der [Rhodothermales bacterium]|nr:ribosome biogenesis GTPase Der [Rhodothermales bacterium]MBO6778377.1 ribosome biogenesis GTPase Der [Rhodothermales bacterium]
MPLLAIVGRPNVGKSTFFNRLTESRDSIVDDQPGVTRDRVYGHAEWAGKQFSVVDTGGFVAHSEDRFEAAIREQVAIAIQEADAIMFVVDVTVGVTDLDQDVAALLRKSGVPVLILANKADNEERRWQASEFYELGVGEVFAASSINGMGTGDLLDAVVELLPDHEEEEDDRLRVAIIGRPNVGKSSLTNAWLGEERSIVTEISGTTRDAVDAVMKYHGREIVLVDTAGLRKRTRIRENVEFYALLRTERAIESCDIAVLLLDSVEGLESQDIKVLKRAEELRKGLVIGLNKWDLVEKETNTVRDYERQIRERLKTLDYVPIVTFSAVTGQRTGKLLETVLAVSERLDKRIPTAKLNEVILPAIERHGPPMYRNARVKIKYATQTKARPPVFVFFTNQPKGIREDYRRYLENRLREAFDFEGVPLTISARKK